MVTPGDPSCCRASSPTADRARFRHRMVRLAPLPPSRSLQGPPETEAATVMLGSFRQYRQLLSKRRSADLGGWPPRGYLCFGVAVVPGRTRADSLVLLRPDPSTSLSTNHNTYPIPDSQPVKYPAGHIPARHGTLNFRRSHGCLTTAA